MARPTKPAGKMSPEPSARRSAKDWRPVFEEKMRRMLYSMGASNAFEKEPDYVYMINTHTKKFEYTKAMSPGADFDASSVEEARRQRIEALQDSIERHQELDSVAQDHNKASTRALGESIERFSNELTLLRNYVAYRRQMVPRTVGSGKSIQPLAQPADPSPAVNNSDETQPSSPRPSSPQTVAPVTTGTERAVQMECPPGQNRVDGWGIGEPEEEEEEQQQQPEQEKGEDKSKGPLVAPADMVSELEECFQAGVPGPEESERRDSGLAGIEETKRGVAGRSVPSSQLDSFPAPDGRRRRPAKKKAPKQGTARRRAEREEDISESVVLEPARRTRPLTAAEKGKWPAKCGCPRCRPRQQKRAHFDGAAMDKDDEDGLVLSYQGFVKMMEENRRTTRLGRLVGLDAFTNPRPAPRVPVRGQDSARAVEPGGRAQKRRVDRFDLGVPRDGHRVLAPARGFPSPGAWTGSIPPGEAAPLAAQAGESGRRTVWRTLSRRFKRRDEEARGACDVAVRGGLQSQQC